MKTRKWPLLLMAILTVLSMSSCQDWGEADPPAEIKTSGKAGYLR